MAVVEAVATTGSEIFALANKSGVAMLSLSSFSEMSENQTYHLQASCQYCSEAEETATISWDNLNYYSIVLQQEIEELTVRLTGLTTGCVKVGLVN